MPEYSLLWRIRKLSRDAEVTNAADAGCRGAGRRGAGFRGEGLRDARRVFPCANIPLSAKPLYNLINKIIHPRIRAQTI